MWVFQEDFEYVIQKQKPQKVCFGSGRPRDTTRKGMSPFMKHYMLEEFPNVAPTSYNALESFNKISTKPCPRSISKRGYSGIARFGKEQLHTDDYPSPYDYNTPTFPEEVKEQKHPFGSTSKRKVFHGNRNPGPGMYKVGKRDGIRLEHSFGGRVKLRLAVDLKCCSENSDTCKLCEKKPYGDYWHQDDKVFLCRPCMDKEYNEQGTYKRRELKAFRKIRDCSSIHSHESTNAKIWLMHPKVAAQWARREAYLSVYLN